jgi:hypothetical protein
MQAQIFADPTLACTTGRRKQVLGLRIHLPSDHVVRSRGESHFVAQVKDPGTPAHPGPLFSTSDKLSNCAVVKPWERESRCDTSELKRCARPLMEKSPQKIGA